MAVIIHTPCHKCEWCLKQRTKLWTARAIAECQMAERTWFGTITLSPDAAHLALSRARARESAQGVDFESLPESERFALWNRQIQVEITKWLKRLRMEALRAAGAEYSGIQQPFRYLLVVERHASGVPHYHALIHETRPDIPVRKRMLDQQWRMGFTHFRLVDEAFPEDTWASGSYVAPSGSRPAHYVCKYLSKDALARVRASTAYGQARLSVTPTLKR